ncbi:hypothetical protein KFE98_02980 [bacterium SCSIO 12741]|nr:hypothetical protein KFE98_02980 [bacterium SCSIO 12741]
MRYILIILCSLLFIQGQAQNPWIYTDDGPSGLSFETPDSIHIIDTLNTRLMVDEVDSLLALQVHVFDSAYFDSTNVIFDQLLVDQNYDTLRAIAKLILLATDSETTELVEVNTNGVHGMQIGIKYLSLAADNQMHSFIRYYLTQDNRFISFSITGVESDLVRLVAHRNQFFASISIQ